MIKFRALIFVVSYIEVRPWWPKTKPQQRRKGQLTGYEDEIKLIDFRLDDGTL